MSFQISKLKVRSKVRGIEPGAIKKTIEGCTPELTIEDRIELPHNEVFWTSVRPWQFFLRFLPHFFSMVVEHEVTDRVEQAFLSFNTDSGYRCAVISLNYDMVFEVFLQSLGKFGNLKNQLAINYGESNSARLWGDDSMFSLIKIHGSVHDGSIVAPTCNKPIYQKDFRQKWKAATELVREANYIVFIGYSMPESDPHFRYLIIEGIIKARHLKHVFSICHDPEGNIEQRFNSLFRKERAKFINDYYDSIFLNMSPKDDKLPNGNRKTYSGLLNNVERLKNWQPENPQSRIGGFGRVV